MDMIITFDGKAKVNADYRGMTIRTDQPLPAGDGTAPAPFDLFLASIGTCAGIYVKSFCDQRGIPTDEIRIVQSMAFDREKHLISKITLEIQLPAGFPEKYKSAVLNAADICAVKRHLHNPPLIETRAVIG